MRMIKKTRIQKNVLRAAKNSTRCKALLIRCSKCATVFDRKVLSYDDPTIDKEKDLICSFCGTPRRRCSITASEGKDKCRKHKGTAGRTISPFKRSLKVLEEAAEVEVLDEKDVQSNKGTIEILAQKAYKLLEECEIESKKTNKPNFDTRVNIMERVARVLKMYEDVELRRHKDVFEFDGEYKNMLRVEIARLQKDYFSLGMTKVLEAVKNLKGSEVRQEVLESLSKRYKKYVTDLVETRNKKSKEIN